MTKIYPLVSIIIVNFNQKQLTLNCLESLNKVTYPNYEIILVDNGSTDGSFEAIKNINFKILGSKLILIKNRTNLGFTGGNNIGYKKAKGKYILLLNNDTQVFKDFLEPLVDRLENNPKVGIVQSKLLLMENHELLDNVATYLTITGFLFYIGYLEKNSARYDKFIYSFSAKGASMMIKKSILKTGLFDESYFAYFEETDLCWRTWILGFFVGYEPKSIVYHKMGATSLAMKSEFTQYHSFKNRIRTILKNTSTTTLFWMLPIHLLLVIGLIVVFFLSGKRKVALAVIKSIWWNVENIGKTLNLRKKIQATRQINDYVLFKYVLKNPPINFYQKHLRLLTKSF